MNDTILNSEDQFVKKCLFCGRDFEELSKEHIIPNAICGRIKSKNLICKDCNSTLGQEIDNGLDGVYSQIINMFNIKRERGESEPVVVTSVDDGKKYKYFSNGDYELAESYVKIDFNENNQLTIAIEGPVNKKKLKGDIGKFFRLNEDKLKENGYNLKKVIKYVQGEIDKNWIQISNNKIQFKPNLIKFECAFGGKKIALVILKILYLFLKNENSAIEFNENDIINILKNKSDKVWDFCHFYSLETPLFDEVENEISHQIFIRGDKSNRQIIGYIKLFSITPYVCVLDNNYDGEDFSYSYGYNLLAQQEFIPTCHELTETNNLDQLLNYAKNFEIASNNIRQDLGRIMELYYQLNPHKKWNEIQCSVYSEIKERLGEELANSSRIKDAINILGQNGGWHFTEKADDKQKKEIINNLTNIILKYIFEDFLKNYLS